MKFSWIHLLPQFIRRRIEGRQQVQNVLGNITWLSFDKVLRMGVGLVVGVWVARYLGPEQYGLWNYAIAFAALFSVFTTLGLDSIVVKELVNGQIPASHILGTSFALRVSSSLAMLVVSVVIVMGIRPGDGLMAALVAITAAGYLFLSFDVIDFWFQSQVLSKYTVYAKNTVFLLVAGIRIGLILFHAPLIVFVWVSLAEVGFSAIALIVVYRLKGQSLLAWQADRGTARILLQQSWPLLLAAVSIAIYMKIDQVMLGNMIGVDAVGIYAAAARISEIWYFIPSAIAASIFPAILQTRSRSKELYYLRIQKLFDIMTGLALVITIPLALASTPVMVALFGYQYEAAGPILSIHIWASVFVFLGVAQGGWDVAENLTKLSMVRTVLGAVLNILLNIILIPMYQGSGAAIATVVSYAFSAYFFNMISAKTRRIFFLQSKSFLLFRHLRRDQWE
ncbi:MAG: flippase [Bacteroidetes bacterium]|nr:flippase [Bacteroidota bacterium]